MKEQSVYARLATGLTNLACFIVGWSGWAIFRIIGHRGQASLLRILTVTISWIWKFPGGKWLYRLFRRHNETLSQRPFTPKINRNDIDTSNEEVVVLFSGGKDSLYVAWKLSPGFRQIHLLTLDHNYLSGIERSRTSVRWLENKIGKGKFVHHIEDGSNLFSYLFFNRIGEIQSQFGPTGEGAMCIPCRMAAETQAVMFCQQRGIRWVAAGYCSQSWYSFNQNLKAVQMAEKFFDQYNIRLTMPLWENPGIEVVEELWSNHVIPSKQIGKVFQSDNQLVTQPSCPFGLWYTINMKRHELTRGFSDYLSLGANYRGYLESLSVKYLEQMD